MMFRYDKDIARYLYSKFLASFPQKVVSGNVAQSVDSFSSPQHKRASASIAVNVVVVDVGGKFKDDDVAVGQDGDAATTVGGREVFQFRGADVSRNKVAEIPAPKNLAAVGMNQKSGRGQKNRFRCRPVVENFLRALKGQKTSLKRARDKRQEISPTAVKS